jgi:isopenicillin N synthase-like dioxygenase
MKLLNAPVIDIGPFKSGTPEEKRAVAKLVNQACRDIGFLVISGHGVDPALIERTRAVSRQFFDQPGEVKRQIARPSVDITRGYTAVHEESLARSRDDKASGNDLNESLMIGPVDLHDPAYTQSPAAGKHFAPNIWPKNMPELQAAYTDYYREMGSLAEILMRIFAMALELPEHHFDDKIDKHISRLRVRNYPAQDREPEPGQIRAGAHSDYGSLTILHAEDKPGGLQVFNADGQWVDVPVQPGCYIINIGDLMARWSNDNWVSTLHRVVNPPAGSGAESRRQSLVFFHNPNYDAEIANLMPSQEAKYPPTTSGEHLRALYVKTQNA